MDKFFPLMRDGVENPLCTGKRTGRTLLELTERLKDRKANLTSDEYTIIEADIADLRKGGG